MLLNTIFFGTQDRVNNCNVWIQCDTKVSEYNLELDLHRTTSNLFIFINTNLFLKHAIQKICQYAANIPENSDLQSSRIVETN